jgi:hypothetical protein
VRKLGDDARRRMRQQHVTRITNPKVAAATNSGQAGRLSPKSDVWRESPMSISYPIASVLLQTS